MVKILEMSNERMTNDFKNTENIDTGYGKVETIKLS